MPQSKVKQEAFKTYVAHALEEFYEAVQKKKKTPTSLSQYRVNKPWGHENWIELNDSYCLKVIVMNPGFQCSLQYHKFKVETNFVIQGLATVTLYDECKTLDRLTNEQRIKQLIKVPHRVIKVGPEGGGWSVFPYMVHRVKAGPQGYAALEVCTPALSDVIRIQDDASRLSGTVKSEHKGN